MARERTACVARAAYEGFSRQDARTAVGTGARYGWPDDALVDTAGSGADAVFGLMKEADPLEPSRTNVVTGKISGRQRGSPESIPIWDIAIERRDTQRAQPHARS